MIIAQKKDSSYPNCATIDGGQAVGAENMKYRRIEGGGLLAHLRVCNASVSATSHLSAWIEMGWPNRLNRLNVIVSSLLICITFLEYILFFKYFG